MPEDFLNSYTVRVLSRAAARSDKKGLPCGEIDTIYETKKKGEEFKTHMLYARWKRWVGVAGALGVFVCVFGLMIQMQRKNVVTVETSTTQQLATTSTDISEGTGKLGSAERGDVDEASRTLAGLGVKLPEPEDMVIRTLTEQYLDFFEPQVEPMEMAGAVALRLDMTALGEIEYHIATENDVWRFTGKEIISFVPADDPEALGRKRVISWGLGLLLDERSTWGEPDSRITVGLLPKSEMSDTISAYAEVLASDDGSPSPWDSQKGPGGTMSPRAENPLITITSYTPHVLPKGPVAAGHRWNTAGVNLDPEEAEVGYELVGFSSIDGIQCAEIRNFRSTLPQSDSEVPFQQTFYVSLSDGMVEFAKVELEEYERSGKTYHARLLVRRVR